MSPPRSGAWKSIAFAGGTLSCRPSALPFFTKGTREKGVTFRAAPGTTDSVVGCRLKLDGKSLALVAKTRGGSASLDGERQITEELRRKRLTGMKVVAIFSSPELSTMYTELVPGHHLLERSWMDEPKKNRRKIIAEVARSIARFHDCGYIGLDLDLTNLYLHRGRINHIDFSRTFSAGKVDGDAGWKEARLFVQEAQGHPYLGRSGLFQSPEDEEFFKHAYFAHRHLTRSG